MKSTLGPDEDHIAAFRPRLLAVAYRMLGSITDAEDAVQDAYVQFQRAPGIESPEAWLVKTTTRLCIDQLRKAKRRKTYHGSWLPEPVPEQWDGAQHENRDLAESLSVAFLLMLETLTPSERAAFLLREAFGYEFEEIGALLDKTPDNVRKMTSRARRRIEQQERRFEVSESDADLIAEQFITACRVGDLQGIEALLARDVTFYSDGGGRVFAAPKPIVGASKVARALSIIFRKLLQVGECKLTTVNGRVGAVVSVHGRTVDIFSFETSPDGVTSIYAVVNPDKLRRWHERAIPEYEQITRHYWKEIFNERPTESSEDRQ